MTFMNMNTSLSTGMLGEALFFNCSAGKERWLKAREFASAILANCSGQPT
jgi:hypothetical protein